MFSFALTLAPSSNGYLHAGIDVRLSKTRNQDSCEAPSRKQTRGKKREKEKKELLKTQGGDGAIAAQLVVNLRHIAIVGAWVFVVSHSEPQETSGKRTSTHVVSAGCEVITADRVRVSGAFFSAFCTKFKAGEKACKWGDE